MIALEDLMRVSSLLTASTLELFLIPKPALGAHRGGFSCTGLISQAALAVKEAKLASPE